MRCNICDKGLTDIEVNWNKDLQAFEPCSVCLEAAMEAAYSGAFRRDEEDIEEEIGDEYGDGEVEILDVDDDTAFGDGYDLEVNDYD